MPNDRHEEVVSNISRELINCGWNKVHNNYRSYCRHISLEDGYGRPSRWGLADAIFEKDREILALEVGYVRSDKFHNLIRAVRLGRFALLSVSFSGRIVLFDRANSFFDNLDHSIGEPAEVWFRKMNLL